MGRKLIRVGKNIAPFSFWNRVFIGNKNYQSDELLNIITHESVHIRQKHSVDLMLFGLLLSFQWFNPFVWLYRRAINITHEYLADQGALNSGVDLPAYQYSLLNEALGGNRIEIASNYNLSIKKRITMMMKKRSPKFAALKLAVAAPILIVLFGAFAFNTNASAAEVIADTNEANNFTALKDSGIKRADVSLAFLKMLEGEYVSTTEAGRIRKIHFSEAMGELFGSENRYIYKIIPVGGGKFINPDDKASFVFDTKDKNAITLLFFGKVMFKKVASTKASVAFSVLNVTASSGLDAGLAEYNKLKGSADAYLYEDEMNYAAYQLLLAGKAKEAAALFKLNTEAFPKSFNVYDSYAEALMALGEKDKAYENYKKTLELNPAHPSAIKALKEAGLYVDTVFKKISRDEMKILEGDYYTTTQLNKTWVITIKEENGTLTGNDNGYKYKLLSLGSGRFLNPDDGGRLNFNTSDKNAITLQLFGNFTFKKAARGEKIPSTAPVIKKADVSADYLKMLAGEYMSTNEQQRTRRIKFDVVNGELVGDDDGYVYRIIPVGDGKFVNPDDGASLVFNTSNKDAISLLLFGKINLNKMK